MKKICIVMMLLATLSIHAQEKKWERAIYVGAGVMFDNHGYRTDKGLALKAGCGIGYHFDEHWSVMPGIAVRSEWENGFADAAEGADDDTFTFLDIPVLARYHTGNGVGNWTFALGPVFSFCVENDSYYIDADPSSKLGGLDKCKQFSFGLQPGVGYQLTKHFSVGVDAFIDLTNLKLCHGLTTGSKHIHDISAKVAFLF